MKPERLKEAERLYNAALECEPGQRAAFLAKACARDESLRAEVESLLAYGERSGGFIEASAMQLVAREIAADSALPPKGQLVHNAQPDNDPRHRPRKRAPWWMYAIISIFLVCAAISHYAFIIEAERPTWHLKPIKQGIQGIGIEWSLLAVEPDSVPARAGMQPGDILGESFRNFTRLRSWEAGRPYPIEIKRNGKSKTVFIILRRNMLVKWSPFELQRHIYFLASPFFLILAVIVALRRPDDSAARWGSLSMGIWAIMIGVYACSSWSLSHVLLKLPRILYLFQTVFPQICAAVLMSTGITFFAVFPRRLFRRRWIWALIWLPSVINTLFFMSSIFSLPPEWLKWCRLLYSPLLLLTFPAIAGVATLSYFHLRHINERRRFRFLAIGMFALLIAFSFPVLEWTRLLPPQILGRINNGMPKAFFWLIGIITVGSPIAVAYAIIRHRLFDIRIIIRLGLQYAAARGVILSLVPIVAAVLAVDLLLHGDQPLMQILAKRGVTYAAIAGGAFFLHVRRRVWLNALDRRFFRDRYDAQRILRVIVDEIRKAGSFEKVAPRVVAQIETALHPEFAALLMRQPGEGKYRVLAAQENVPPLIAPDSKLMGLVRLLGKPVEISQSQSGWLRSQLPRQESEFLRQARVEWLFPISVAEDQPEALLMMGPKRSEEPYSWEDQELLMGITNSLAWLLEQSVPSSISRAGFEECPKCGTCYDTGSSRCANESSKLTPVNFSRFLARRYRFEQRLGEGGMGTVYRAFDTELERQVAVKLIRSDMTMSAQATARFRQEAKAAASFTHPNVVTVHDFGVAENQQAYLVMELLRGLTLREELGKSGRLPAPRAAEVLQGVCTAVAAAHQLRLLHRDLKPENIFLTKAGDTEIAKILDFGVVKPIASAESTLSVGQTGPGMLLGTLKYMSPEQLRGETPAESWDLWALGVVAYEMLAGVHPFDGSSVLEIHNVILAGRVTPLRTHLPEAPAGWQHFFDRALSMNTESRFGSALQLFSVFRQAIA